MVLGFITPPHGSNYSVWKSVGSCGNVRVCDAPPRESNWREWLGRDWGNVWWDRTLWGTIPVKRKELKKKFRTKRKSDPVTTAEELVGGIWVTCWNPKFGFPPFSKCSGFKTTDFQIIFRKWTIWSCFFDFSRSAVNGVSNSKKSSWIVVTMLFSK
jgi:hypothetical protein